MMLLSRARSTLSAPLSAPDVAYRTGWAVLTLVLGVLLARLPLAWGAAVLAAAVLAGAAVWEPVVGLGLAMTLGPARAYLAVTFEGLPLDPGQVFFGLAVAGWLARGLAARRVVVPRLPLLLPLGLFTGVGLLSQLAAVSLEEGLKEVIKWAQIGVALLILVSEAERGRARALLAFVLTAGLTQALLALWQYGFRGTGPEHFRLPDGNYRAYGTFEQPNPLGGFLGLVWPVAAGLALAALVPLLEVVVHRLLDRRPAASLSPSAWRRRWLATAFLGGLAALMLGGLFVSFSRGAWLGAAAAGLALSFALPRRNWQGLALVAGGGALAAGLALAGLLPASIANRLGDLTEVTTVADVRGVEIQAENFAIVERLAHWQAAAGMARERPWLGVGLGNYGPVYPRYALLNWPNALGHAHMIYLNVLAETGVLGLAAYLLLWGSVVALNLRVIRQSSGLTRGLALGLLAAWAHLSVHQLVDSLYVNNIHFLLAGLLALLVMLARPGTARLAFAGL
jgi:O-antigen ligase